MFADLAEASASLDVATLFVIAIFVTTLLGLFLLFAWTQEKLPALAWWAFAYLIGGFAGALWRVGNTVPFASGIADVLLFIAVGMIWSAARLFHGRPVLWGAMCSGAALWVATGLLPALPGARVFLSSGIVAVYTFLIAAELWRERRKSVIRRWPVLFVPMLHGAIFLFPVTLASLGVRNLGTGWMAVFAIEVVLYVVGAAFIVLMLAKDRSVNRYKTAAETDPLTGLLNRRGFFQATETLMARHRPKQVPVTVLAFDLDRFKSINDSYGHKTGDAVLGLFARVARKTLRSDDIVGRIGGEEFLAVLPSTLEDACIAAERVRTAFEAAAVTPDSPQIAATVSAGVACGLPTVPIDVLIARADAMLYRAKENGRNRVEPDEEFITEATARPAGVTTELRIVPAPRPMQALTVPIMLR